MLPEKAKFKVGELEVLLNNNYVLPPTMTKCKVHGRKCIGRSFLSDDIMYEADDKFMDWFITILPAEEENTKEPGRIKFGPGAPVVCHVAGDSTLAGV